MQAAKSSLPGFKFSALDEFLNQCKCMSEMLLNTIPSVYIYVVYIYKQQQKKSILLLPAVLCPMLNNTDFP